MREHMFSVLMVLALLLAAVLAFPGCQSTTVVDNQAMAFVAGSAVAYGYTNQSSSLTPEQRKMAIEAIKAFRSVGAAITPESVTNLGPTVDEQIDKNISDPAQRQMAKSFAVVILGQVQPYMENQTVKDSILIFGAFCKGLGTADTGKIKLQR